MGIIVKNILVEVHHLIKLVKRYHSLFCLIYNIITTKFLRIKLKLALNMFFKTFNNLTEPNGLVSTLFIFSVFLYMTHINVPSTIINQRIIAICQAMGEVRKFYASYQVNNILNIWNSFFTSLIHNLSFNLPVLVFLWSKCRLIKIIKWYI